MRVAALYDVHAMPWALEAVLADVADEGVDAVVFGGDLDWGPYPDETLELASLRRRSTLGARELRPRVGGPLAQELPMTVALDGVLYCHSTPADDMPIVTAETPVEALDELFADAAEDTVVIGHTHHQFDRRATRVRIVNAGSVGMPYEGEVAAFWAVIEDGEPRFRKTSFDVERAIAAVGASEWPQAADFVAENLQVAASREEAIASLEDRRS